MKNTISLVLLTVAMMTALITIAPTSILAQKSTSKRPIRVEDFSQEIQEAHQELSGDKVKFFALKAKNLSEVTVDLYDESKNQTASVTIRAKSQDITEYKIQSQGKEESVQIKKSENNGKVFFELVSSNGSVSKMVLQLSSEKQNCESVKKVLSIDIANGDIWESFSAIPENNFGNSLEDLKSKFKSEDEKLFNTPQLNMLRSTVMNFTKLQQIVTTKSLQKAERDSNEFEFELLGKCNVMCWRTGILIPKPF
ncbi:MAG: hypothetical protein ABI686_02115 [Acidobacteriota bacterium]